MTRDSEDADWPGYRRLVLDSFRRIEEQLKVIQDQQSRHDREIAMLQVKCGLWGAVAGLIVAVTPYLVKLTH